MDTLNRELVLKWISSTRNDSRCEWILPVVQRLVLLKIITEENHRFGCATRYQVELDMN